MDITPARYLPDAVLMLDQCLRHRPNIKPILGKSTMFAKKALSRQYIRRGQLFRDPRSNTIS